jgi:AcrR family transcriptional regulator
VTVLETPLVQAGIPAAGSPEERIIDAALRCIARWGVSKTTLDDVARQAGCSRATVYRLFPGGKDGLLDAVCRAELARFFVGLTSRLEAVADHGLEALLVAGMSEAGRRILDHPALQYVLTHEPDAIAPRLAFAQMDLVLRTASAFATPWLARHLDDEEAAQLAEWVTRILISYAAMPADGVDIGDEESIRRLVRTYVLPGLNSRGNSDHG